jgi:tetratricopeptide (TPR) repeat protein
LKAAAEIDRRVFGFLSRADVRLRLGVLAEGADSVAAAAAWYASVRQTAPGSPAAAEAAAREFLLRVRTGEADSALTFGAAILREPRRNPFGPRVASAVGAIALRRGLPAIAIDAYRTILSDFRYAPQADSAGRLLADALLSSGEYDEALTIYQHEYALARDNPFADR